MQKNTGVFSWRFEDVAIFLPLEDERITAVIGPFRNPMKAGDETGDFYLSLIVRYTLFLLYS